MPGVDFAVFAGVQTESACGFSTLVEDQAIEVVGQNALNETYRIGVLGLIAEGLGFQSSAYGEPRMYGIEVGYKF